MPIICCSTDKLNFNFKVSATANLNAFELKLKVNTQKELDVMGSIWEKSRNMLVRKGEQMLERESNCHASFGRS